MIRTFEQIYRLNENIEDIMHQKSTVLSRKHYKGQISDEKYEIEKEKLEKWYEKAKIRQETKATAAANAFENDSNVKVFIASHSAYGSWGVPGIDYYTLEGPLSQMKHKFNLDKHDEIYDDKTLVKELKKRVKKDMEQFYKTRQEGYDPGHWRDYFVFTPAIAKKHKLVKTSKYDGDIIMEEYESPKSAFS